MKWEVPPDHVYKVNVDGAFSPAGRSGGWGFVIRNGVGEVLEAGAGKIEWAQDALQTEALAAMKGLEKASYWGMPRIILETDAANLGCALTSEVWDDSPNDNIFRGLKEFMASNFTSCIVKVCPRECNRVADGLASHGRNAAPNGEPMFWCSTPSIVRDLVSGDMPVSSN
ncbi:hypothetical protein PR202_gb07951 [Eleusine coracana subsp. coracana]|uniref:RNase H type-1 domain-containing protein n=1 Tax=Eleusine coracana subsp. coracana TaxID=191504 RepID=A0AAV5EBR7_ELECO|nr:hypothetical protein PR202_gb07951 [Eleusine coracana subsp. coracana]